MKQLADKVRRGRRGGGGGGRTEAQKVSLLSLPSSVPPSVLWRRPRKSFSQQKQPGLLVLFAHNTSTTTVETIRTAKHAKRRTSFVGHSVLYPRFSRAEAVSGGKRQLGAFSLYSFYGPPPPRSLIIGRVCQVARIERDSPFPSFPGGILVVLAYMVKARKKREKECKPEYPHLAALPSTDEPPFPPSSFKQHKCGAITTPPFPSLFSPLPSPPPSVPLSLPLSPDHLARHSPTNNFHVLCQVGIGFISPRRIAYFLEDFQTLLDLSPDLHLSSLSPLLFPFL